MLSIVKIYFWKGITRDGKLCQGNELLGNIAELSMSLYQQGILVRYVYPRWTIRINKAVKKQHIVLITQQISRLLAAGLPFIQVMKLLESSEKNNLLKNYLKKIIINIENGGSIAEAMSQSKSYFSKFYCNLIALGEKTATLGLMFDKISIHQEKSLRLTSKILHALVYPAVVLLVAVLVFIALLLGVVPQFQQFFTEVGAKLPLLTQAVISLSQHVGTFSLCLIFLFSVSAILFFLKRKYSVINTIFDKLTLKLPGIKKLLAEIFIARLSRTLSIALAAGLPLLDALQLIAEMTNNVIYKSSLLVSCEQIRNGDNLYQALFSQQVFPADFLQLVRVGEIANQLVSILHNSADLYEKKIDYFVDNLSVLLEPLLMIILGLMVGCLVTAMYLPIFKLGSVI